jgi:SAM-dependent methyltransferase
MTAFQKAELYEILGNRGERLDREGPFLLEALVAAPSKVVADLACGLGLHAVWLAEQGAEVHAFDLSPEMVAHAQKNHSHPGVTYAVGDMCEPSDGPYGLVLCLGNSLSLLDSKNKLKQFFEKTYNSLLPDGIMITQTLNYTAHEMKTPRIRVGRAELPDGQIIAIKRFQPLEYHSQLSINYLGVTGTEMFEATESFVLQHWTKQELSDLASDAGFKVEGVFGGYDYFSCQEESSDILLRLRKSF